MRSAAAALFFCAFAIRADEPKLIVKPDAFPTLVNPNCSHCIDEARRRKGELKDDDRVLVWTRGKYDGGAIPFRFFLNSYPVISDTYGVFIHDPDAGYARGFKASLDFTFHGWRNGIMVMKHKDGTLYSCLSGVAFDGPRKGTRLESWPTVVSNWGWVMSHYPNIVAYHMFDKYKPVDAPAKPNEDSLKSRGKADPRLPADEAVLGVEAPTGRSNPRAYRLSDLDRAGKFAAITDTYECGTEVVILWQASTRTAAAYFARAQLLQPTKELGVLGGIEDTKYGLRMEADGKNAAAPFIDRKSGSRFDIAGRCVEGDLKGYCLDAKPCLQVKWFAWAAEFPHSTVFQPKQPKPAPKTEEKPKANANDAIKEVAGAAEYLRSIPKKYAIYQDVDAKTGKVKLLVDGEKEAKEWRIEPDAEIKVMGWWGRLEQIPSKYRVWVWFKTDRKKQPTSILMIADEISEQDIHGPGLVVKEVNTERILFAPDRGASRSYAIGKAEFFRNDKQQMPVAAPTGGRLYVQSADGEAKLMFDAAAFEKRREDQRLWLRKRWEKEGLPGSVSFVHLSGEADLMLDHETMRWVRSLKTGDKVKIAVEPPINAVVKNVTAWRERTQLRVVINGQDLPGLAIGQHIHLQMTPPSEDVINGEYPPDIDKPKTKEERLDWFLANTYCCCKVGGDGCTGHFYTLASCNPNACAAPNATRKKIAEKIDAGLSNKQIWNDLKAERGANMLKPHLAP